MAILSIILTHFVLFSAIVIPASFAQAETIAVTTEKIQTANDGLCSLVEAIDAANTDLPVDGCRAGNGADIIELELATYTLIRTHNQTQGSNGFPVIASEITIEGVDNTLFGQAIQKKTLITRNDGFRENTLLSIPTDIGLFNGQNFREPTPSMRFFTVTAKGSLILKNLTLSNGLIIKETDNLGIINENGGAILNNGKLTLENTTLDNNKAVHGGAIYTTGDVFIMDSVLESNMAIGKDGFKPGINPTCPNSTFPINKHRRIAAIPGLGGSIGGYGNLTINRSHLRNNSASQGGAIHFSGLSSQLSNIAIYNSVIIDNSVKNSIVGFGEAINSNHDAKGAAIFTDEKTSITLLHVNLTDNRFFYNGQGCCGKVCDSRTLDLKPEKMAALHISGLPSQNFNPPILIGNSIFERQFQNCNIPIHSDVAFHHNWFDDTSCNSINSGDSKANEQFVNPDSLAIDAADNFLCANPQINNKDLLGNHRPINGDNVAEAECDIGAIERQSTTSTFSDGYERGGFQFLMSFNINHTPRVEFVANTHASYGFSGPATFNGSDPGIVRFSNIFFTFFDEDFFKFNRRFGFWMERTDTVCDDFEFGCVDHQIGSEFSLQFQEYQYLDNKHLTEQINYLGTGPGIQRLENGETIIINHFELTGLAQWKTINLPPTQTIPYLFLSIQSNNGTNPVSVRVRNVTNHSFEAALFEEEATMKSGHVREYIAYLVIDNPDNNGLIEFPDKTLPYMLERVEVDHRWTKVLGHEVKLEEEKSSDQETRHFKESVDAVLIDDHLFTQIVTFHGSDPVSIRQR